MAAGDKILSSLATGWYNSLNTVVNTYGPGKTGYTVTMNSTSKEVGQGAGVQVLWTGTAPEAMRITSITAHVTVAKGSSSHICSPRLTFRVNDVVKASIDESVSDIARTINGLSIDVKKGNILTLYSEGYTYNEQDKTFFKSGSFTFNSTETAISNLATADVAAGNGIHAADLNNLLNRYNSMKADNVLGAKTILDATNHANQTNIIYNFLPIAVNAGASINWTDTAVNTNTTTTKIETIKCRNIATCTFSCSQTGSVAHPAYGTNNYRPAYGCNNYRPAYGTNNYVPAYCGNNYRPAWCGNNYRPAYGTNNYRPAYGTNNYVPAYGTNNYVPASGTNDYKPAYGTNDYKPAHGCNNYTPAYGCNNLELYYCEAGCSFSLTTCYGFSYGGKYCKDYKCGVDCYAYGPAYRGCSDYHDASGCNDYHAATGCTDYHPATGCTDYHAATGCTNYHPATGCTNYHPPYGCTNYHPAYGCTNYHPEMGCYDYHPSTGCTDYHAFYTSTDTITISNCSNTTAIDILCKNATWKRS